MTFFFILLTITLGLGSESLNRMPSPCPGNMDTLKIWPVSADRIAADPLGQFYMISAGSLVKYDSGGDSAFSWSEPQTGQITMIDAGDPMRILVYQKDFNLLRFLNNRLAPISGPISLDDLGLTATLAIAVSRQGGFWVLDGTTHRIQYIDQQLKTLVESVPLNLSIPAGSSGYQMMESGDQVFLLVPGREIQVFDLFANLVKTIPLQAVSFHVYGNWLLLAYPDHIVVRKDVFMPDETVFRSSGAGIREACLYQNKLLIRTADQVILINR